MAVKLLPKDFPGLLDKMKENLPDSIAVYTAVELISRGLSGYEVYVDRFPDVRAVLVKPDDAALQDPEHEKNTYIYCTDSDCLQDLLDNSGLLKQQQIRLAFALNGIFEKADETICKLFVKRISASADLYCCRRVAALPELPDGYKARKLGPEDSDTVLTGVWYKDNDFVKSVKRVLQLGALSVGVEDPSGQLVAWTLQHVTGLLGMTYVIPEHRNRKLGKYVTVALAQNMIDTNGFCLAGIEDGNSVSVALHEGVGFTRLDEPFCFGFYYEKGYASNLKQLNFPDPSKKNWKKGDV